MNPLPFVLSLSTPIAFGTPPMQEAPESPIELRVRPASEAGGSGVVRVAPGGTVELEVEVEARALAGPHSEVFVELEGRYSGTDGPSHALGSGCRPAPFVAAHTRWDHEVVVGLFPGGDELRVFELVNGAWIPVYAATLGAHIEALAAGDADGDGLEDIVVGLAGSPAVPRVQIFRHDPATGMVVHEFISGTLPHGVECVTIGDADGDGENEVVVGFEELTPSGPPDSLLLMYEHVNGVWVGPQPIEIPVWYSVQDVVIADPDNDGRNEVAALFSDGLLTALRFQVRLFEFDGQSWVRETTGSFFGHRADRMVIGDVDGDGLQEIVAGRWNGADGQLVQIEGGSGSPWTLSVIASGLGTIDGLDLGDLDGNSVIEVLAGTSEPENRLLSFEHSGGAWGPGVPVGDPTPEFTRDVAFGDADRDGCREVLGTSGTTLLVHEQGSTQPAHELDLPQLIDSVLVADFDNDSLASTVGLRLGPFESWRVPFRVRADAPAGTSWELSLRAKLLVREPGAPPRAVVVDGPTLRVEVGR